MRISDWSSDVCSSDLINYLMLMMVDPHVHFHVLPRYDGERSGAGLTVADAGWPAQPDLRQAVKLGDAEVAALTGRSEEHTSELQSLMRISYAVFCLQKKTNNSI